ncbi:class II aldolase/adducin family protein [Paragemmobacter ruber]|uniref:Class II aldolase n=1 Tax=Paragemmobacter ruber TaxID=1985673 RepID=A0ABW9Y8M9_9RHOB|nr:class II aldolase/adducin family protein [Rhodobacter ruber]NBE08164.1 class II aldolase [Rhodobacter ruber]
MTVLPRPADLPALARLSARIGADPLLIQGAGGNTSVKEDAVMWIKASGTLLADALTRDVFVPCDLGAMRAAMAAGEARADRPGEFALVAQGLRPSIETSLHAVFPQRVVVHVHCVNTLALAIRQDAGDAVARRLAGFGWAIVPYAKPGAELARQVQSVLAPGVDVVVLRNHGLIVAADTVAETEALLSRVVAAVTAPAAALPPAAMLAQRADGDYRPLPPDHPLHTVARLPHLLRAAQAGSLYPDHVVFCGVGAPVLGEGDTPAQAAARIAARGLPRPAFLLVPGQGALIARDASAGAEALTRCLGDVLARLPEGAEVAPLTDAQNAELLNWDAEKYRQSLNVG